MFRYWKWLYKIFGLFVKTSLAKLLCWFGFDLIIALGIASILAVTISAWLAMIVLIISFMLLIGHMLYLMVEVYP